MNNHSSPKSEAEDPQVDTEALEDPTPIAKFGSMAEAGFFIQELEFHLNIPATIFEDQAFDPGMGAFKSFAQIIVPGDRKEEAIEFLKEVFQKDEQDAEALEELFGKENPTFDDNSYASDEEQSAQGPLRLFVLVVVGILGLLWVALK